jgi:Uncharacterized membrane-anchored protein
MRKIAALIAGLLVLLLVNASIYQREQLLSTGNVVLLELAPVDPRSLMQGDYMALRFKLENDFRAQPLPTAENGRVVVQLDERGVATFLRRDDGSPLRPGELALKYRIRNTQLKFATNAFFFEEGTADRYTAARYGEFRVAPSGDMLLTALRDKDLQPLGAQTQSAR